MSESGTKYHKALEPLKWIFGTWQTTDGCAAFPSMKTTKYIEVLKFKPTTQAAIKYKAQSYNAVTKEPLHSEMGFLCIKPDTNQIAMNISHFFGCNEICEGHVTSNQLTVSSTAIEVTSIALSTALKQVTRNISFKDNMLMCEMSMGTTAHPMQKHLEAKYTKIKDYA